MDEVFVDVDTWSDRTTRPEVASLQRREAWLRALEEAQWRQVRAGLEVAPIRAREGRAMSGQPRGDEAGRRDVAPPPKGPGGAPTSRALSDAGAVVTSQADVHSRGAGPDRAMGRPEAQERAPAAAKEVRSATARPRGKASSAEAEPAASRRGVLPPPRCLQLVRHSEGVGLLIRDYALTAQAAVELGTNIRARFSQLGIAVQYVKLNGRLVDRQHGQPSRAAEHFGLDRIY